MITLSHSLQKKTVIGTPQALCLDMHQSGLFAIIRDMRSSPQEGIHLTFLMASSAFCLRLLFSMDMNHCFVDLKITGFLHLQQWGYSWVFFCSFMSAPHS